MFTVWVLIALVIRGHASRLGFCRYLFGDDAHSSHYRTRLIGYGSAERR